MSLINYIESMNEVYTLPEKNIVVASTFSGAGGSCLGYRMAGCKVVWANEFVESARKTYLLNNCKTFLNSKDIREIKASDILKESNCKIIDILDGSPPCAAFSTAGKINDGWVKIRKYSDKEQRVDDLFFEYIRICKELQPKMFISENVTGLIQGKSKGYFNLIFKEMKEKLSNYSIKCYVLDASRYGVPQMRKRIFFIGVNNDFSDKEITPPKDSNKTYCVKDFKHLDNIRKFRIGGAPNAWRSRNHPYPTVTARIFTLNKNGYLSANGFIQDFNLNERKLSLNECKVICGFPLDFKLDGSMNQKYERLGRAVPPILMANLVNHLIKEHFLGHS